MSDDIWAGFRAHIMDIIRDALKEERGEIAYLMQMQAIDHEHLAEESARNEERDDQEAHNLEAGVWRRAAELVSARNDPPKAVPVETAEDIEPEPVF